MHIQTRPHRVSMTLNAKPSLQLGSRPASGWTCKKHVQSLHGLSNLGLIPPPHMRHAMTTQCCPLLKTSARAGTRHASTMVLLTLTQTINPKPSGEILASNADSMQPKRPNPETSLYGAEPKAFKHEGYKTRSTLGTLDRYEV